MLLDYLIGLDKYALNNRGPSSYFEIKANGNSLRSTLHLDHNSSSTDQADALFGYGVYQLELWKNVPANPTMITSKPIIIDYRDINYSYMGWNNMCNDLYIYINSTEIDDISFHWMLSCSSTVEIHMLELPSEDRHNFKCYKQYQNYQNNQWIIKETVPNTGTYNYGITRQDELLFPIDGTELSNLDYRIPRHDNSGLLVSPLEVLNNHIVKIKCGKNFTISNNAKMKLTSDIQGNNLSQIQVGNDPNNNNCGAIFRVLGNPSQTPGNFAWLYMMQNCSLIVNKKSHLILENQSLITMIQGSKIIIESDAYFCNYGARFGGIPTIIIRSRNPSEQCYWDKKEEIYDSTLFVLEDSAVYVIPDSSTIRFDSTSKFVMKPNSEIRFGKNSKIIFERGSSISCDNAKFTSLDSTQTWDGIYLDGIAYDTLKNCTFQNAVNGINITENYDQFGSPGAVEINNCTFKNSTGTELLNYVYINNSYNVLVKGCNAVKTGNAGFTSGIIAEYCPAGGVVVCDNNIN